MSDVGFKIYSKWNAAQFQLVPFIIKTLSWSNVMVYGTGKYYDTLWIWIIHGITGTHEIMGACKHTLALHSSFPLERVPLTLGPRDRDASHLQSRGFYQITIHSVLVRQRGHSLSKQPDWMDFSQGYRLAEFSLIFFWWVDHIFHTLIIPALFSQKRVRTVNDLISLMSRLLQLALSIVCYCCLYGHFFIS